MSYRELLSLPIIVKQEVCESAIRIALIVHGKQESLELPEPTQVINLKQYRTPDRQKEIITLINDMLDADVLVPMNSLNSSLIKPMRKADGSWLPLTDH